MIEFGKKKVIDRRSSVPLYKQIKDILIDELKEADGEGTGPFSTEYELIERFSVSRAPVRQALKELADEGYIYRERAKGIFPAKEPPVRPPGLELGGLVGFLRERGMECTSEILRVERTIAPEHIQEAIGFTDQDKFLGISRLIKLEGNPFIWSTTHLLVPEQFQPSAKELEKTDSIFVLLESELGITISRGDHEIWASGANCEEAKVLGINVGAPVLVIETKLYSRNEGHIGFRRAIHKADDYKFSFSVNR